MPQSYSPAATWHTSITEPSDGDNRTAASMRTPLEQIADNAKYLKDWRGAANGLASLDANSRVPVAQSNEGSPLVWAKITTGGSPAVSASDGPVTVAGISISTTLLQIELSVALTSVHAAVLVSVYSGTSTLVGIGHVAAASGGISGTGGGAVINVNCYVLSTAALRDLAANAELVSVAVFGHR